MPVTEPPRVDVRYLLANERTLLAWVRTSLALLAAGGAVFEFTDIAGRRGLAAVLAAVGVATALLGAMRYVKTAAAIHLGSPLTSGWSPAALAYIVTAIGVGLFVAVLVG